MFLFRQQQTSSYQSQLDRRKDILDSTEANFQTRISQLEGQLKRASDSHASQVREILFLAVYVIKASKRSCEIGQTFLQERQLQNFRSLYEESMKCQNATLEEKEILENELDRANAKIRV